MQRHRTKLGANSEKGVVITLVAVFMLFVIGAMAALSIDVVTLYTARSEAQLAADGAALAAARVLVNSGMTSNPADSSLVLNAENLALNVATQVATQNSVGGRPLHASEVTVNFNDTNPTDPRVTVQVQRTDLPTFFARIWGRTQVTVGASATAEAYNPSGAIAEGVANPSPVAPLCVKPWLLPNIDPTNSPNLIFDTATGAINNTALLGWKYPPAPADTLRPSCIAGNCTPPLPTPVAWHYYPGNPASFPAPPSAVPACSTTPYENSIAGCVQTPIACGSNPTSVFQVEIDTSNYTTRNTETADAVNCLTHSLTNEGDRIDPAYIPPPFEFLAGNDNPIPGLAGNDVMVSDSLVTVPVFDVGAKPPFPAPPAPPGIVQIVGFVQLFLSPDGTATFNNGHVNATIINMVGCGIGWTATPILGNGASPVVVRLISPP